MPQAYEDLGLLFQCFASRVNQGSHLVNILTNMFCWEKSVPWMIVCSTDRHPDILTWKSYREAGLVLHDF